MFNEINKHVLTQAIADSISTVAAAIGFTGGFTYVAGYLAVSFYLSQYGVSTLSLVQSRYFAAGGLYLIVSLLISSAPLLSLWMIDRVIRYGAWSRQRWGLLLLFASSLLLAGAVIWLVRHVLTTIDDRMVTMPLSGRRAALSLSLPASQVALLFPAVVYYLARWGSRGRTPAEGLPGSLWMPAIFASAFVVSILVSIFVFARYVYPHSTPSLGGGAPTQVQLALSEELTDRAGFPLKVTDGITEPVLLLDQSVNALLVLQPSSQAVLEVSNAQVLAVLRR